jgi:hypothetical protein
VGILRFLNDIHRKKKLLCRLSQHMHNEYGYLVMEELIRTGGSINLFGRTESDFQLNSVRFEIKNMFALLKTFYRKGKSVLFNV